ncbi:MAG: hypothetical protein ACYS30_25185 [Planctomycetota bacterium]|jgi:hypothetical protein
MAETRLDSNVNITGNLTVEGDVALPAGVVDNDDIAAAADIDASKQEHQYVLTYAQDADTKSVSAEQLMHNVHGSTGVIDAFECGTSSVGTGTSTITVALVNWRAGTTAAVLDASIVLDSGNSIYIPEAGTISASTTADGDALECQVTCADGDGAVGKGFYATLTVREDP